MPPKKSLYLLRHAKAEAGHAAQEDHDRVLAERGRQAAADMGKYLASRHIRPARVLCSTAVRTVETLMKLEAQYHEPLPVEYSDRLYMASINILLSVIATVPDDIAGLMLIGHNPGVHQLALKLAKSGDDALLDQLAIKFPTCAFVAIDLGNIHWGDAAHAHGKLDLFVTPKDIDEG
jgi:phosphohistidine phosphatase